MGFMSKVRNILSRIANNNVSLIYFILFFFFATNLRNFIELFFSDYDELFFLGNFFIAVVHYNFFYISLACSLIIFFTLISKEKVEKVSKIILTFFFIVVFPPIFDLIVSGGKGYNIGYIMKNFLWQFLTFFSSFDTSGVTIGIRIEIALVLLGSFIYFLSRRESIIKSLFFTTITYCLLFVYLALPFFLELFLKIFGLTFKYSALLLSEFFVFLLFFQAIILFYLYNKKYFISIINDIKPLRLIYFELMFLLGVAILTKNYVVTFTAISFFNIFLMVFAIAFAWLFCIIVNDIEDYDTDRINNRSNSIISNTIPKKEHNYIGIILLTLAFLFSAIVSFKAFFLIFLFVGNYFMYSLPPLKLKRITFFSKMIIGLNSLILILAGYTLFGNSMNAFPGSVIIFTLIFFSAAANFIDIKDYQGDKQTGIKTLPVILGLKQSKILIGILMAISYIAAYTIFFQNTWLLIPLILLGILQFYLINKTHYNETPVLVTLVIGIIGIIIHLIITKP